MTQKTIRPARPHEMEALNGLIHVSARTLSQGEYSKQEIEGPIQYVFGMDSELVQDQTYFVIEKEDIQQSQIFLAHTLTYLRQALEIIKTHFLENSLHRQEVELKIQNLEHVRVTQ